jgi:TonB family protein
MTPLASAVSRALIHFIWQGSLVGLALWGVLSMMKHRSANSRYTVSCFSLLLLFILPIATATVFYSRPAPATAITTPADAAQSNQVQNSVTHSWQATGLGWVQAWALPLWSLGVVVFSMRFVLGYRHAFTMRRRGKPAFESVVAVVDRLTRLMGVRRSVRVLMSSMSDSPSVVGWLKPVILLPSATLMGLTPLQLEAILAHEIGHIKRYDYLVNMLQMLGETLLFYHPAVWWTSKRIRLERELCCDDLAVRFSGNALRYARALTTLEKLRLRTPSVVMASTGGPLLYRIERLVGVRAKEQGAARLPFFLAMALVIVGLSANVTWIRGQDAPGVKVDLGSSAVIHRSSVPYPEPAKKQGITGTVQLEVKLDSAGNVADAHVLTGPEELRKAALESVLNWHFTSDAARTTRSVSITFSEQGTQVQIAEPPSVKANYQSTVAAYQEALKRDEAKRQLEETKIALGKLQQVQEDAQVTRGQELEKAIAFLKQQLEANQNDTSETGQIQTKNMEAKLAALKAEVDAVKLKRTGGAGNRGVVGRVLKGISTFGLSDSVRADLIARLPLREGDVLTGQSLEAASMAVRSYDEHLRIQAIPTDDGQAELRITAPGERR